MWKKCSTWYRAADVTINPVGEKKKQHIVATLFKVVLACCYTFDSQRVPKYGLHLDLHQFSQPSDIEIQLL